MNKQSNIFDWYKNLDDETKTDIHYGLGAGSIAGLASLLFGNNNQSGWQRLLSMLFWGGSAGLATGFGRNLIRQARMNNVDDPVARRRNLAVFDQNRKVMAADAMNRVGALTGYIDNERKAIDTERNALGLVPTSTPESREEGAFIDANADAKNAELDARAAELRDVDKVRQIEQDRMKTYMFPHMPNKYNMTQNTLEYYNNIKNGRI